MNYQLIIDHYYSMGKLHDILMVHSRKVADKAMQLCKDSDMIPFIEAAAMLHDIGIIRCDAAGIECYGTEPYICHGRIGAQMLREDAHIFGLSQEEIEPYARVCERHTGAGLTKQQIISQHLPLPHEDFLPETLEEQIICYADKFFSKTHPEVEKPYERALKSIEKFGEEGAERFKQWHERFNKTELNEMLSL